MWMVRGQRCACFGTVQKRCGQQWWEIAGRKAVAEASRAVGVAGCEVLKHVSRCPTLSSRRQRLQRLQRLASSNGRRQHRTTPSPSPCPHHSSSARAKQHSAAHRAAALMWPCLRPCTLHPAPCTLHAHAARCTLPLSLACRSHITSIVASEA